MKIFEILGDGSKFESDMIILAPLYAEIIRQIELSLFE